MPVFIEDIRREASLVTTPKQGDKVAWKTPQGETRGTVEKTVTSPTTVKGHTAAASKAAPEVLVKSEKTGKKAVHKPGSLKQI